MNRKLYSIQSLLVLSLIICISTLAFGEYRLFFVPNPEFEENLDSWFFTFVENSEVNNTMGTASWSNRYGGSLYLTASGNPLGSAGVAAGINTFLCPGDRVICRYTMENPGQINMFLGAGRAEWSQAVSSQSAGTREMELVVNKVYMPGTLFDIHLSVWYDDNSRAWIHNIWVVRDNEDQWGLGVDGFSCDIPNIPGSSILSSPFPNPTNAGALIRFELSKPTIAEMSIYDINGRLIKTFSRNFFSAGENTISWDGLSDVGQPVTSGTYYYELKTNGERLVRQAVIIR